MAALVTVHNVGETTFRDLYAGKEYVIPPGARVVMEAEAPCLWLGYPGLRDDPLKADFRRRDQHTRLRQRYGWHQGIGETEETWEKVRPKLEVYTMDDQRVWMILDDPEGTKGATPLEAAQPSGTEEIAMLRDAFERQQAELEAMRKLILAREEQDEIPELIAEDKPRKVPVGARSRGPSER